MAQPRRYTYPPTRKQAIVEDYHGTPVADPYRWLEDPDSPETQAWVEAQNRFTFAELETYAAREAIRQRLTALWNYPKYFVPEKRGNRYFYQENDGLRNQPVLYLREALHGAPRLLLDPSTFSADGTIALTGLYFDKAGQHFACVLTDGGSDWQTVRIYNVDTGEALPETLERCRFSTVSWHPDGSGFFYNRYPLKGEIPEEDLLSYSSIYFHALGTPQSADPLIYQRPELRAITMTPEVTEDGAYLVISIMQSFDQTRIHYAPLAEALDGPSAVRPLLDAADANYVFSGARGASFYFVTEKDASRGRLIAVDLNDPAEASWRTILPEDRDVLAIFSAFGSSVHLIHDQLVAVYLRDAHHVIRICQPDGRFEREIPLPTMGAIDGLSGHAADDEMFLSFTSFLVPPTIFRYDFTTGALEPFQQPTLDFDASAYETTQVFYPSKDGTQIPMFLTHKKGLQRDGSHPTLLYAYGGFNVTLTPDYQSQLPIWLENGGIYAQPTLRGGGEYGEAWHRAGMLANKQNVFDDFIAAAEWLIASGYTRRDRLAMDGRSNGGLLTGACMTQRPDLYGAVICEVGVLDMLRYHRFTAGRYWVSEYGNAEENAEHFRFLLAYSPLHNVRAGTSYPPTLITTADHDDRVVPLHSEKFAATLQAADAGHNPILIRLETKAGHGFGKPTSKQIEEQSDILAFLFHHLKIELR